MNGTNTVKLNNKHFKNKQLENPLTLPQQNKVQK